MTDCAFCAIVRGQEPAEIVQFWRDALAIVPLNPVVDGHLLVIPRQHVTDAAEDPGITAATMKRAALLAADRYLEFNVITSAGPSATQTVPHLHLHLVPRRPGDGLALPWTGQAR